MQINYQNAASIATSRSIRPLAIWNLPEGWMFSGWCDLRQGFRTFRLDRIATLTVTAQVYDNDPAKNLTAFMAQDTCEP